MDSWPMDLCARRTAKDKLVLYPMLDPYIQIIKNYPESYLSDLFLLLALGTGLVNYAYLNTQTRWLFRMLILSLIITIAQTHHAAFRQNNLYLYNLNSLIEMGCLTICYSIELQSSKKRWILWAGFSMYLLVFLYDFSWTQIAGIALAMQRLIMIVYALLYFHIILIRMQIQNLLTHSMFWVSAGAVIHAAGTLFVFLFIKVTLGDLSPNGSYHLYITVVMIFLAFFYIILLVSFWLRRREVKLANRLTV